MRAQLLALPEPLGLLANDARSFPEGQSPDEGGKSETRHLGPSISVRERGRAGRGQQQQQQLGVPRGGPGLAAPCSSHGSRQQAAGEHPYPS